jgi:hypothetical protein
MITVSIKSDLILKYTSNIFTHINAEKRIKLDNLFSSYRNCKVYTGFFKRKVLVTDEDIIEYITTKLSWMDEDRFCYYRINGKYNQLLDKFDLIVDMAKLSNHVVFSDKETYFIDLIRKCEVGEI